MDFFRSPLLRRILYAIAFGLALVRFVHRAHSEPMPRLVVACGRRSIGPALAVKRLSKGRTLAAYVQNPEWGLSKFDLVAAMPHDGVRGENVALVPTALHSVSQQRVGEARERWR